MTDIKSQIIREMKVLSTIDVDFEIRRRIDFIKDQLLRSGLKSLVLGISGGVDSSTCGRLCQLAVEELNADGQDYRFIAVRLPYSTQADEDDAQQALKFIAPMHSLTINIADGSNGIHNEVLRAVEAANLPATTEFNKDFNKGNVKARLRMTAHYEVYNLYQGLVSVTDHITKNIS